MLRTETKKPGKLRQWFIDLGWAKAPKKEKTPKRAEGRFLPDPNASVAGLLTDQRKLTGSAAELQVLVTKDRELVDLANGIRRTAVDTDAERASIRSRELEVAKQLVSIVGEIPAVAEGKVNPVAQAVEAMQLEGARAILAGTITTTSTEANPFEALRPEVRVRVLPNGEVVALFVAGERKQFGEQIEPINGKLDIYGVETRFVPSGTISSEAILAQGYTLEGKAQQGIMNDNGRLKISPSASESAYKLTGREGEAAVVAKSVEHAFKNPARVSVTESSRRDGGQFRVIMSGLHSDMTAYSLDKNAAQLAFEGTVGPVAQRSVVGNESTLKLFGFNSPIAAVKLNA